MNKRKKFQISSDIAQGLTDAMRAVDNHSGESRFSVISLNRIEIDPENPRELLLQPEDIINGLNTGDKFLSTKKKELLELQSLANTIIDSKGVINPIVVFKYNEKYRIVAGERRYLASLLAKKQDIEAKILNKKPDLILLRKLQWVENHERKDLTLRESINNLKALILAYLEENADKEVNLDLIQSLIGLSKAQASRYLSVLRASNDLLEAIESEKVNSLDKANLIANTQPAELRKILLEYCILGKSLKELKKVISQFKDLSTSQKKPNRKKPGRSRAQVDFGKTKDLNLAKKLIKIILDHPDYSKFQSKFNPQGLVSFDDVSNTFKNLMKLLKEEK